ncbi:MAG TPA: hydroxyacylglutathione hydrolase [Polyangiaceae bacterium]
MSFDVTPIACLSDNYAYAVKCTKTGALAIVDPSEVEPVAKWLGDKKLTAIWNTHHHPDHCGGNEGVAAKYHPDYVAAHASDKGRIPGQTKELNEGDSFKLGDLDVSILHIPGHTTGAIAFVVKSGDQTAVFTGDTLFLGGCGRLFEGTPEMMHTSLQKLAKLPKDTAVYCGHEYTQSNLKFELHVEPSNTAAKARAEKAADLRAKNLPTVPGLLEEELATNPFLRTDSAEIRKTLGIDASADGGVALGVIRKAKDGFKG